MKYIITSSFKAMLAVIYLNAPVVADTSLKTELANPALVKTERGDDLKWNFSTIPRPSRSDVGRMARISIVGAEKELSCLPPQALNNGVLPWRGIEKRDFFTFSSRDARDGRIVMDMGEVTPVAAVASYSYQEDKARMYTGVRAPQVYTLYGSAEDRPDPSDLSAWIKIAEVDTRPLGWGGRHGSFVQARDGEVLGSFRWLLWEVERTVPPPAVHPGTHPGWTNTWFAELDVHTPETLKTAGDAVMAGADLEEVTVLFKTHFDIGFTHRVPEIVHIYRTSMIDQVLDRIEESKTLPPDQRFSWTIPSWVMHQILWDGQDPVRRERVINALKDGSIQCHALPVSLHTESLDLETLASGLDLHTRFARELGLPLSRSGKMTDVPSHSWILPTLLGNAGIDFLHIGTNPSSERPELPLLYHWEGPDGSRVLTFHNQGYGSSVFQGLNGMYPPKDWPYKNWLILCTESDNAPPPSASQLQDFFAELKRNLPHVEVTIGTMEDFADAILAEEKAGATVPVVRMDQPDFWIHGMGSMPETESAANRQRPTLASVETLDAHLRMWGLHRPSIRAEIDDAHERSLMYGEHTWGGAKNLHGRDAYAIEDFESFIRKDQASVYLQTTWNDKANYIWKAEEITDNLKKSALEELAAATSGEGDRAIVFNPLPYRRDAIVDVPDGRMLARDLPPSGYKTFALEGMDKIDWTDQATAILENPFLRVTLDRYRGGIISIVDKKNGRELVDQKAKYAFGQYLYQRFDQEQTISEFIDQALFHDRSPRSVLQWYVRMDLPGDVPYAEAVPTYESMRVRRDGVEQTVELVAPAGGIISSKVITTITLPEHAPWLEIAIQLDGKKPDYWPESGGFYFPVNAQNPQFRIGRVGAVVDPEKDFARASSRTYGYVNTGAMIADADGVGVAICPLDHGIMSFGKKGLNTFDADYVPTTPVGMVNIFNNLWHINFPYWVQGPFNSRVRIWATHNLKSSSLVEPALEARQPALTIIASGPGGTLPAEQPGLELSRTGIRVTAFRPYGNGTLLRIWEQSGVSGNVTITLPSGAKFKTAQPVNLRGQNIGDPVKIEDGKLVTPLGKYAPVTFLLK